MAVQANGVTVLVVDDRAKSITFLVGAIKIKWQWDPGRGFFLERYRTYEDGRRSTGQPHVNEQQWKDIKDQAYGIQKSHKW